MTPTPGPWPPGSGPLHHGGEELPEAKRDKPAPCAPSRPVGPSAATGPRTPSLQSDSPSRAVVWSGPRAGSGGIGAVLTPDHPGLNRVPQDLRNPGAARAAAQWDRGHCRGSGSRAGAPAQMLGVWTGAPRRPTPGRSGGLASAPAERAWPLSLDPPRPAPRLLPLPPPRVPRSLQTCPSP